ncbi:MAG: transglycosylase SLT domain-containing protein [Woeseia sp.]|nr:transglycosylase SLT domain-containing protein [Woeseia sp.]MBT8097847.1 transglycosylase SLT domain-containing protein [Woeseia sp.]NND38052.1 transglycosylase SLT domain-containing protein [Pseudomonadales bacterium]NNE62199.1 transglycosylase SLT domain-containing protein [Woeseia sp.]NNL55289.1 transglycosylase SLT domain-containing protein [Woeseia sp.]
MKDYVGIQPAFLGARFASLLLLPLWLGGCATAPPENVENICEIFEEKKDWFRDAKKSRKKWGTPISVQMAIIRQESSFKFNARPPRRRLLGIIPWTRPSNAYGYAQVLDSTWKWYKDEAGSMFSQRDDFGDAIDFVGWYTSISQRTMGIAKTDPYNQYLAYHEGHNGWQQGTHRRKRWLMQTARKVEYRAKAYNTQLKGCEAGLDDGWWIF